MIIGVTHLVPRLALVAQQLAFSVTPADRAAAKAAQQRKAQQQQIADGQRIGPGPDRPVVHQDAKLSLADFML